MEILAEALIHPDVFEALAPDVEMLRWASEGFVRVCAPEGFIFGLSLVCFPNFLFETGVTTCHRQKTARSGAHRAAQNSHDRRSLILRFLKGSTFQSQHSANAATRHQTMDPFLGQLSWTAEHDTFTLQCLSKPSCVCTVVAPEWLAKPNHSFHT